MRIDFVVVLNFIPRMTLSGRFLLLEQKANNDLSYFLASSSTGTTSSNGFKSCFWPKKTEWLLFRACCSPRFVRKQCQNWIKSVKIWELEVTVSLTKLRETWLAVEPLIMSACLAVSTNFGSLLAKIRLPRWVFGFLSRYSMNVIVNEEI